MDSYQDPIQGIIKRPLRLNRPSWTGFWTTALSHVAVSRNWGPFLWVSLPYEPCCRACSFDCLKVVSKSVQVLLNCIEAVMVLTLISLE